MEEKVLEFTTHNESLFKERQQSRVKISELERRNSQLDANLKPRELAKVEIELKLEETSERLRFSQNKDRIEVGRNN